MLLPMMDKKKIVSIVLGQSKPEEKEVSDGLESDFSPAFEAAAKDIIDAVKGEDMKKLVSTLKDFISMCEKEDEYSPDEEE